MFGIVTFFSRTINYIVLYISAIWIPKEKKFRPWVTLNSTSYSNLLIIYGHFMQKYKDVDYSIYCFFFLAMFVTTQMELSFIIETNKKQNVTSIWINKDAETRDKNAVLFHYVLYVFALYEYNPIQTNTATKIFLLQHFYTVGVMLKWLELTHGWKRSRFKFLLH